jgi:carboxynorspermidine decarboxylase
MAEDSARLIDHIMSEFATALKAVSHVNLGGGHYITHPDYKVELLIDAVKRLQEGFNVQVTLEPGGSLVYGGGYLAARVMDVIPHSQPLAILDASASTHMPDVLEVPYRPHIIGSGERGEKAYDYILGGNTCMTGDVIGEYSFDTPLEIGQMLLFTDMMQYSFVKNTTFNGVPLPDLAILHEDGRYEVVKRFGYADFEARLS